MKSQDDAYSFSQTPDISHYSLYIQIMDPIALKSNTSIDMGEAGFTLDSNKPSFSGGVAPTLPAVGFYNPTFNFEQYLNRFFLLSTKVFTVTEKVWEWNLNSGNLTGLKNFESINTLFQHGDEPGIWPTSLEFLFVVHSPFNINGILAAYHDPGDPDYNQIISSQFTDGTDVNEEIVRAMNLKAVICSLCAAREMRLSVPINYPVNIPRAAHHSHGKVHLRIISDSIYLGAGVNSVSVDIYVAPTGVMMAPLNGS